VDKRRADQTIALGGLSPYLGMLLSATLGIYMLHVVGLGSDGIGKRTGKWHPGAPDKLRNMIDVFCGERPALSGGGTRPLHDLPPPMISNMQAAKSARKTRARCSNVPMIVG